MYCLQLLDLLFFVKGLKHPSDSFHVFNHVTFHSGSTRSSSNRKLEIKFQRTSTTRHQYFNRISLLWNIFSPIDLHCPSLLLNVLSSKNFGIYLLHTLIQTIPAHFVVYVLALDVTVTLLMYHSLSHIAVLL